MTPRWALAWMLVGSIAVAYPLWRPSAGEMPPMDDETPWLRTSREQASSHGPGATAPAARPWSRRSPRELPERPSLEPLPIPTAPARLLSERLAIDLEAQSRVHASAFVPGQPGPETDAER
jgi:hypothetical protein